MLWLSWWQRQLFEQANKLFLTASFIITNKHTKTEDKRRQDIWLTKRFLTTTTSCIQRRNTHLWELYFLQESHFIFFAILTIHSVHVDRFCSLSAKHLFTFIVCNVINCVFYSLTFVSSVYLYCVNHIRYTYCYVYGVNVSSINQLVCNSRRQQVLSFF